MLLLEIGRFLGRTGMPPTKFGRLAIHDPRLIGDIRRGRQLGPDLVEKIERFMAEYRP